MATFNISSSTSSSRFSLCVPTKNEFVVIDQKIMFEVFLFLSQIKPVSLSRDMATAIFNISSS